MTSSVFDDTAVLAGMAALEVLLVEVPDAGDDADDDDDDDVIPLLLTSSLSSLTSSSRLPRRVCVLFVFCRIISRPCLQPEIDSGETQTHT